MIRTTILAIVAATITSISSAADAAYWSNSQIKDLKNALRQVGVNVRHGLENDQSWAVYDRVDNEIIMFMNKNRSNYNVTFVHEAIHVLQDCYAGLENGQDTTLIDYYDVLSFISYDTKSYVNEYYKVEDRHYEYEAEGYARQEWEWTGGKTLAYMIRKYC